MKPLSLLLISVALISLLLFKIKRSSTTLSRLKDTQATTLSVGTNAEYPPFCFINEQGSITGFDIELIKEVAKRLGKTIELHNMPFTTLIPQVQSGSIQIVAAGMSPTPERAQQVFFTQPYLTQGTLVVLMHKNQLPSEDTDILNFLKTKRVIVNEGFIGDAYLEEKNIKTQKLGTVADALMALRSLQADAFVSADTTLQPFFAQYGSTEFATRSLPNTSETIALIISKKYPELLEQCEKVLQQMKEDGSLEALKRTWKVG